MITQQILNSLLSEQERPGDAKWDIIRVMIVGCILVILGSFTIWWSQLVMGEVSGLIFSRKVLGMIGLSVTAVMLHFLSEQAEAILVEVINEFLMII